MTQVVYETDNTKITRRGFIQMTAVVGASLAILPHLSPGETILRAISPKEAEQKLQAATTMNTIVRTHGFCAGGFGVPALAVDVMNDKIVRTRPLHFDWQYKLSDLNFDSWAITAKNGKTFTCPTKTLVPPYHIAYKKRAYSLNRVNYPLKRVDFDPTQPPASRNQANRGKSKWVRITWDDALTMIYNEITRVVKTYGPTAIYEHPMEFHGEANNVHSRGGSTPVLNAVAGTHTTEWRDPDSWEGWYWGSEHMWSGLGGMWTGAYPSKNLTIVDAIENTELGLFWSGDPETPTWGWTSMSPGLFCYWMRDAGMHVIYITPSLNYGAMVHADKWIPIYPNTDSALQLAIAYTWITEGTYDRNFVATHTFGFDETTQFPAGAPANSSFKSYVLGISDGVPKTPKWAEPITGVPSRIIKALAREFASKATSIFHCNGGGMIRGPYSTEPARLEVSLLAMQGVGKPGVNQICMIEWGPGGPTPNGTVDLSAGGAVVLPKPFFGVVPPIGIQKGLLAEAILNPPISWYGNTLGTTPATDQFNQYTYPATGNSEIHMIWAEGCNQLTSWLGGYSTIQAYRSPKMEFIFYQVPWLEDDAMYGDLVLPVTTGFENDIDLNIEDAGGLLWTLFIQNQCIQPIGESKSDLQVYQAITQKFDAMNGTSNWQKLTGGVTTAQAVQNGFNTSGAQKYISWDDFQKKQYWVSPVDPNWATDSGTPGCAPFYNNPSPAPGKANSFGTPSGKIEFFCQDLFAHFPDDTERPPLPHYIQEGPSHQESRFSARASQYSMLLVSAHCRWRVHSQQDDISWTREIETCKVRGPDGYQYEPIWIHPIDAAKRGIQNGDILRMYNDRGSVLGGAIVTERTMPGTLWQDHAARIDCITDDTVAGGIDRGGSNNLIAPHNTLSQNCTGIDPTGYLVEVEKADMAGLMAQYPNGFHSFDPDVGPIPAQTDVTTSGSS